MYERSAAFYDAVSAARHDYTIEAEQVRAWIQSRKRSPGNSLLDVACGTGAYLPHFRRYFVVEGLDLSADMLSIARQRNPQTPLHQGDLVEFDLRRQFDAVVCLGSAIGYARTVHRMRQAIQGMAHHVVEGGVVIVEPWLSPEEWEAGRITADLTDEPSLKVARVLVSGLGDSRAVSMLDIYHLAATPQRVEYFVERHEMGLFTDAEYVAAFESAGLDVFHDPEGLTGRGLFIGSRS